MRAIKHTLAFTLLLLCITKAADAYEPFTKEIWLNETQTPVNVHCITEDKNGYIWIGTENGLYKYNGRFFFKIKDNNINAVTAIAIHKDAVWVGYKNGKIGIVRNDSVYYEKNYGAIPNAAISSIKIFTNKLYVAGTQGEGVFVFANNVGTQYSTQNHLTDDYTYNIISPETGVLLVATDQGINEAILKGDNNIEFTNYTSSEGLPDNIVKEIAHIAGTCWSWVGGHQGGLALFCNKRKKAWIPQANKEWSWGQVNDILVVDENNAWVSTAKGFLLNVTIEDSLHLRILPYGYPGKNFGQLIMDETGNIWCATNTGLQLFTVEYMSRISLEAPYHLSSLTAMSCDKSNNIWMSFRNKLYVNPSQSNYLIPKEVMSSSISDIYTDENDNLWIGTFGNGVWIKRRNANSVKITSISSLINESVLDINGRDGHIWITGLNGIHELSIKDGIYLIKTHNKNTGVGSDYVYETYTTPDHTTWMATDGAGVCRYSDGKYTLWDTSEGMVSPVIYNITGDSHRNIWAATLNSGLLKYNDDGWKNYARNYGLLDLNIASIAANEAGQIVVVHKEGIDIWYPISKQFRHINKRSGFGIDSISEKLKLTARDASGCVYVPYQDGLICFKNQYSNVDIIPKIVINNISTFFSPVSDGRNEFTHEDNHISFDFTGISYSNPELLYFRYKLEGYNDTWIETKDESITFPKLPSGNYNFIVQASNNSSFQTFGETSYSFTVKKPFWMQLWFIIVAIALAWALAILYIRIRERNLRKVSLLQKERMVFEYEHLKSQVNPHFLFNSLNTLSSLIDDDKETAQRYTDQLSDLYRNMLSFKDKDVIYLWEELEIINSYLFIQKSRFGEALQINTSLTEEVLRNKKIVPMALQILLENAIKHNVVSMSKPLNININTNGDYLTISNNIQPKLSKEKGAGLGLINIRKRYKLLAKKEVAYYIEDNNFTVKIPLI